MHGRPESWRLTRELTYSPADYMDINDKMSCPDQWVSDKQIKKRKENTTNTKLPASPPLFAPAGSAPLWYTPEEIRHYLQRSNYAPGIADELAADYATNLQKAFEKGFSMGQRQARNEKVQI